jgi:hypothetical protein
MNAMTENTAPMTREEIVQKVKALSEGMMEIAEHMVALSPEDREWVQQQVNPILDAMDAKAEEIQRRTGITL